MFWREIRKAWCCDQIVGENISRLRNHLEDALKQSGIDNTQDAIGVESAPTLYVGHSFSSSAGKYLFVNGVRYPHWPVMQFSDNSIDGTRNMSSPSAYFNLSLQDMNWVVHSSALVCEWDSLCESGVVEAREEGLGSVWVIQFCDEVGWEGTGSLCFSLSPALARATDSHSYDTKKDSTSSRVEIPLNIGWSCGCVRELSKHTISVSIVRSSKTGLDLHVILIIHMIWVDESAQVRHQRIDVHLSDSGTECDCVALLEDRLVVSPNSSHMVKSRSFSRDDFWENVVYCLPLKFFVDVLKSHIYDFNVECATSWFIEKADIYPMACNDAPELSEEQRKVYLGSVAVCSGPGLLMPSMVSTEPQVAESPQQQLELSIVNFVRCIDGRLVEKG